MKTTTTFTSTIEPGLLSWVDRIAKTKKRTRRAVLEEAVRRYQKDLVRASLKEGFERAARDPEILELAEMGVGDYARFIDGI